LRERSIVRHLKAGHDRCMGIIRFEGDREVNKMRENYKKHSAKSFKYAVNLQEAADHHTVYCIW